MIINANNIGQFIRNMNIENVRNTQTAKKQQDRLSNADAKNLANLNNIKNDQTEESKETSKVEMKMEEIKNTQTKAFFALDENENVVIRIVDHEGTLLRQIPPEEYLKMVEQLRNFSKNIFSMEV